MFEGGTEILMPVILLVLLGAAVLLGAYYARRTGHLQSRGARIGAGLAVVVLAVLIWLGPGLFWAAG